MKLDDIDRLYRDVPIPLRGKRVMTCVGSMRPNRAQLYEHMSKRRLDPSRAELDYLIRYLIGRELIELDATNRFNLVPSQARSERARTFDAGESNVQARDDEEEDAV